MYKDSVIHQLHPMTKIVLLLGLSTIAFLIKNVYMLISIFVVTLIIALVGKISPKELWKNMRFYLIFLFLILILISFIKFLDVFQAIVYGSVTALRFNVLILAGLIFVSTLNPQDLPIAFAKMKFPPEVSFVIEFGLCSLPIMMKKAEMVLDAQRARGYEAELKITHLHRLLKWLFPIIIPLLLITMDLCFKMVLALKARGFDPHKPRKSITRIHMKTLDYVIIIMVLGGILATFYL